MVNRFQKKLGTWLILSGLLILVVAGVFVVHSITTPRESAFTTLVPATASPGSTILVSGSNYPSGEQVKVYFQTLTNGYVAAVTDGHGSFAVTLRIPWTFVQGTPYYVHVDGGSFKTAMLFTFAKLNISLANPNIQPTFGSLTPFSGTGFRPNETVNLVWNFGKGVTLNAGTVVAGSDGSFAKILTMPSIPHSSRYQLVATGGTSRLSTNIPIAEAPGIIYDPSTASVGTTVNVKGGAFDSNELVNVSFDGVHTATARANQFGAFTTSFTLADSNLLGYQDNAIVAVGATSGMTVSGGFTRVPSITINPNHGKAGTKVKVSGKYFSAKGLVHIYFVVTHAHSSQVDRVLLASIHALPDGTFSVTVTIPNLQGLTYQIVAVDVKTGVSASATFIWK